MISENAYSRKSFIKRASCKTQNLALNRHSGQAQRDPESRIIKYFWIPAFAGMTENMTFARASKARYFRLP